MDDTLINTCIVCLRSLIVRTADTREIIIEGEVDCCCGSIDKNQIDFYEAQCTDCCPSMKRLPIWEGKSAGGGYYIRGE
jgi:hypothetical protein